MDEKKLKINFGFATLCVETYSVDGANEEIAIYVEGKGGVIEQDIALITKAFRNDDWTNPIDDYVEIRIWGDSGSEDYTDRFRIAVNRGDELL